MGQKLYCSILVLGIAVSLILGMIVGGTLLSQPSQAQQIQSSKRDELKKQEVRVITASSREGLANEANKLGEQGWILVSVIIDDSSGYLHRYTAYLQRTKS